MSEVNYNDGLWHGWNGGDCPAHPETVVDLTVWVDAYGSGSGLDGHTGIKAGSISWHSVNAFRIIKEHKEPRQWWCVLTHMFDTREAAERFDNDLRAANPGMNFGPIFSVREVME